MESLHSVEERERERERREGEGERKSNLGIL